MPSIFQSHAGALTRLPISSASALVTVDGLDAALNQGMLLATSLKLDRAQDVQYQKTLAKTIYAYAFGEGVGRMQLGGYVFFTDCASGSVNAAIHDINAYYDANNIYARADPVMIAVGGSAFSAYLETLSIAIEENPFNFGAFNLLFSVLPKSQQKK
jgi:hypothetical protein